MLYWNISTSKFSNMYNVRRVSPQQPITLPRWDVAVHDYQMILSCYSALAAVGSKSNAKHSRLAKAKVCGSVKLFISLGNFRVPVIFVERCRRIDRNSIAEVLLYYCHKVLSALIINLENVSAASTQPWLSKSPNITDRGLLQRSQCSPI